MPMIEIPDSEIHAYLAEPSGTPRGGLVVIHEIWGLVDHIKDVADRFAAEGYLVAAPDILSSAGVTPSVGQELAELMSNPDEAVRTTAQPLMREKLTAANEPEYAGWAVRQLRATVSYLGSQPGVEGRLGVTGFCFGGSYSFALATAEPRLRAAAPFYGSPPDLAAVASIACPVHAFYGELDQRLMDSLPQVSEAMKQAGVDFEATVYPDARHAFFNDTNSMTYNPTVATDAWGRVLDFFASNLQQV